MAWFKKSPPAPTQPPVDIQFDQCCYTLVLSRLVDEHTNAETLWQKKFTASPQICAKNSQNENYRLQAALDKNTANIHCYNEKLKRTRPEAFVYSDVVVWLPQAVVDKELRLNTGALNSLTGNLPVLHLDRFKEQLLNKRPPHYVLLPSSVLQADEVAFQFGFGIYVADPREVAQLTLEAVYIDEQDKSHPFTPQISYQVGNNSADNRIFPAQENLLIIKPGEHLCTRLPYNVWFSDLCSHIQLQRNKDQWKAFASSGCADSIKVDIQQHGREWRFEFSDNTIMSVNGKIPRLVLTLKSEAAYRDIEPPVIQQEQTPPFVPPPPQPRIEPTPPQQQSSAQNPIWGRTIIPDPSNNTQSFRTIIPMPDESQPLLVLEGLALPRIDNKNGRVQGLKQWTIWFDDSGNIVGGENRIARRDLAAVSANQQQACAYFRNAGQSFAPLSIDSDFYCGSQRTLVLPSPLPERFHAIVKLPNPISFALQENLNYTVGRKADDAQPEIDLTLLNDQLGLEWEEGSPHKGGVLSMLSLSRNHLNFTLQNEKLVLTVPANKQPVYLLNSNLSLKETLQDKLQNSESVLMANEYLLLGSFVLRFKA